MPLKERRPERTRISAPSAPLCVSWSVAPANDHLVETCSTFGQGGPNWRMLVSKAKKSVDLAQLKQLGFYPMKSILHRIGRLAAVPNLRQVTWNVLETVFNTKLMRLEAVNLALRPLA